MAQRLHKLYPVLLAGAFVWSACGGDEVKNGPTISVSDKDAEVADARDVGTDTGPVDPRCEGRGEGASCELANAVGVCVAGSCQFLSCQSGYRDCDASAENGCETDITRDDSCGRCGVTCQQPQSCQLSRAGWVCSVSPVCPQGRVDLDGDPSNGCEWSVQWGAEGAFVPPTVRPQIGVPSAGGFAVAGTTADGRLVTSTQATTAAGALPIADDPTDNLGARSAVLLDGPAGELLAVAWPDAVTLSSATGSSGADRVFQYDCDSGTNTVKRQFTAVAGTRGSPVFAATTHEVLELNRDCGAGDALCSTPAASFGQGEYLAAYRPDADPDACGGCQPDDSACPTFAPIDAQFLPATQRLAVFTRRGFLLLETSPGGLAAGPRFESAPDAGSASYVAGAAKEQGGDVIVMLLTDTGTLRRFIVSDAGVRLGGPDVGLPVDAQGPVQLAWGPDQGLLVTDGRRAWLVGPLERSARVQPLSEPQVFLGDGRVLYGAGRTAEGFSLLYFGVGRYYLRQVTLP